MASLNKATLRLWLSQTKRYWLGIGVVLISVILANVAIVAVPLGFKRLTDAFIGHDDGAMLTAFWLIIGLELLAWALWRVAEFVDAHVETRVLASLMKHCFTAIHHQTQQFFEDNLSGGIARRVNQYAEGFITFYSQIIWNSSPSLVCLVGAAIVLGRRQWLFAVILVVWGLVYGVITWRVALIKQRYEVARADADSAATGHLNDTISNQLAVRTTAALPREIKAYAEITDEMTRLRRQSWLIDVLFDGIQSFLMIGIEAGLIWLAIVGYRRGVIQISDIVLVQAYMIVIINNFWGLSRFFRQEYESLAGARGMTEIFLSQEDGETAPAKPAFGRPGEISLHDVSFSYQERRLILRRLNLKIAAGERAALVGPSGGGKSTIFKLLLGLYTPNQGEIKVGASQIAFVSQDTQLFHRSIKDNIRYARPRATDKQIKAAAKAAQADGFIKALPQGYDTLVGERGVKLSGGERQRIALARAFLRDAPIVLLDEPTSSLDSLSERLIQKALAKLMVGRTVLVIAHRLATIRQMDKIHVVDRGRITESGTHQELTELRQGTYQRLWEIQTSQGR